MASRKTKKFITNSSSSSLEEEELKISSRRVTRQMTGALSPAITPAGFPAGTRVEVRISELGYRGSWFEAFVTDWKKNVRGRVTKYVVEYVSLVKEDEPDLPETDEVEPVDVRPEAPRKLRITDGNETNPEFELYDLVEVFQNEGWWFGVISGLRNTVTGEYRISFPFSNEVFNFSPDYIRPQMNYLNGNWIPIKHKPEKEERYETGDKVETMKIREKYGISWFPSTIEKIITDNIFLIKYENNPNGYLTEIVECSWLRPSTRPNPKSNKIILNSQVEFFHDGSWSNGIVTRVNLNGNYLISFGENNDELFNESFVRLRYNWDGIKWIKARSLGKRGRPAFNASSVPAKRIRNDISVSPRGGTSLPISGLENCRNNNRVKRAVAKLPKNRVCNDSSVKSRKPTEESSDSQADVGADIIKGCSLNRPQQEIPCSKSVSNNNLISTSQNPNQVSTAPNPKQLSTPQNPNANKSTPSSSVSCNIVLPFKLRSPIWNSVQALDVFRKIPQTPHFANLQKCCEKEELEGKAIGQMVNYDNLYNSIKDLTLDTQPIEFTKKLEILNSLEQDGFYTDPLRTRLNKMIELKNSIYESGLKIREKEREVSEREEDNKMVIENVDKMNIELEEMREKMRELVERERNVRERREKELEKGARNVDVIVNLKSEICRSNRNVERAKEEFLVANEV